MTLPTIRTTFALRRIDRLTGRIFSAGTILTGGETFWHGLEQHLSLVQPWFWLATSVLVLVQLFNFVNFWFLKASRWPYLLHGAACLFVFATWGLQTGQVFEAGMTPWFWTAIGPASIAVGMFAPRIWAIAYILLVPVGWALMRLSPLGGSVGLDRAITDGVYSTLFPAVLATLVWMLRRAAIRADYTAEQSLAVQISEVSRETRIREQTRLDSILYISIFDALKLAARAKNSTDYSRAVQASKESLDRIEGAKNPKPEAVSTMTLFETLERLVARIDPACVLSIRGSGITFLPSEVASGLSDATVQALNNSLQHAGAKANRAIHMKATRRGVKLVISDTGIGFRPSKVPAHSLGLRFVIFKQVEAVGGRVHIDSQPRQGTKVVLEWEAEK